MRVLYSESRKTMNVVILNSLYETVPQTVERTWKERLFSLPWHPFQKTKTVYEQKPALYKYDGTIFSHPLQAHKLSKSYYCGDEAPTLKVKAVR